MNRIIYTSIILIFLSICFTKADSLQSMKNSNNFVISRNISLNGKNITAEQSSAIKNMIIRYAGNIVDKFSIKKITMPTISVKSVSKIPGIYSKSAFQIDISNNSVKIKFTSVEAINKAIETLYSLIVVNVNGEKCFQGGKYIWTNELKNNQYTNNSHMASEIKQLLADIPQKPSGSTIELIVVTHSDWMIETSSITDITKNDKLYNKTSGYVSIDQLKEVIEKANQRKITIYVSFQFDEDNIPFYESTGHSIFSVEGMRFFRAALSEWHDKCAMTSIKVTTKQDSDDVYINRFNKFLKDIAPLIGITIQ